jgi:hypothetical protein
LHFGAIVPATEHDFGCGDQLHGGELDLKMVQLDPGGEVVYESPTEPSLAKSIREKDMLPWPDGRDPLLNDCGLERS